MDLVKQTEQIARGCTGEKPVETVLNVFYKVVDGEREIGTVTVNQCDLTVSLNNIYGKTTSDNSADVEAMFAVFKKNVTTTKGGVK